MTAQNEYKYLSTNAGCGSVISRFSRGSAEECVMCVCVFVAAIFSAIILSVASFCTFSYTLVCVGQSKLQVPRLHDFPVFFFSFYSIRFAVAVAIHHITSYNFITLWMNTYMYLSFMLRLTPYVHLHKSKRTGYYIRMPFESTAVAPNKRVECNPISNIHWNIIIIMKLKIFVFCQTLQF